MAPKPILTGQRLTLRDFGPGDAADRLALGQCAEIIHMFGGDPLMDRVGAFLDAAIPPRGR